MSSTIDSTPSDNDVQDTKISSKDRGNKNVIRVGSRKSEVSSLVFF